MYKPTSIMCIIPYPTMSPTDTHNPTVTEHHQQSRKFSLSFVRVSEKTNLAWLTVCLCADAFMALVKAGPESTLRQKGVMKTHASKNITHFSHNFS